MYYIYLIENLINGKMYVGQTINPDSRYRGHFSTSSKCPYIAKAISKYGRENFSFFLLETFPDLYLANEREKYWIKELDTLAPLGYNLREGGDAGGKPSSETIEKIRQKNLGRVQSSEEKEKRASSHRGRKNSPETIEKMRKAAQNRTPEKCSMFGKKFTTEHKRKIAEANKKDFCKRGHPMEGTDADIRINKSGSRDCRACNRFRRSGTTWKPSSLSTVLP